MRFSLLELLLLLELLELERLSDRFDALAADLDTDVGLGMGSSDERSMLDSFFAPSFL